MKTLPKPIHDRLILHPSDSRMRGSLFIPERYQDASTACQVLAVGEGVPEIIKVGDTVLCQTGFGDRKNNTINQTRAFWCRLNNVYAILKNNIIFPIGNKILIRRDIEEAEVGGILIPENRRYQSLDGTVVRFGITRKPFKVIGIEPGMRIRLKEWTEDQIGITLEDGSYGLIVSENDILFKYE